MKLETVWRPHIKRESPLGADDRPRYTTHFNPATRVWELIPRPDRPASVDPAENLIRFASCLARSVR